MIKKILFILYNIIVTIALLELCLYLFNPAPLFEKITITSVNDNKQYEGQYVLSPNQKLIYVPKPNTGSFNELGYRGKRFPLKKNNKKTRIIFMGDSVVYGINTPHEECFTSLLNKQLGDTYEIINLAVPGYNILQEIEYCKEAGIQFKPDYVIFGITANDLSFHSPEIAVINTKLTKMKEKKFYYYYYSIKNKIETKLLFFNIYRYIKYFSIASRQSASETRKYPFHKTSDPFIPIEEVHKPLQSLINVSIKYNINLAFIILPINPGELCDTTVLDVIYNFVVDKKIKCFNLYAFMSENYDTKFIKALFPRGDPFHFNEKGHAFIANLIYQNFDLLTE